MPRGCRTCGGKRGAGRQAGHRGDFSGRDSVPAQDSRPTLKLRARRRCHRPGVARRRRDARRRPPWGEPRRFLPQIAGFHVECGRGGARLGLHALTLGSLALPGCRFCGTFRAGRRRRSPQLPATAASQG